MPVNPVWLTDAEVRASLTQIVQAITMQSQAMTVKINRHNVHRENPPVRSMTNMLRDFMRMNPSILTRSNTSEYPQDFLEELHKILESMGA
ncbi:hypothetical protein, partial [Acinetobacter baumannii]|uniref:hypothetical protein n=1 Tax=Acinetobacter baumannii TaxID=470 RepID=UPI00339A9E3D